MPKQDAQDVIRLVLALVGGADWKADKNRIRTELAQYLTDDLFAGEYELVNVPDSVRVSDAVSLGEGLVEITVHGFSLPDKATLLGGSDGRWRLKSYLGLCTGCLGTG